MQPIINKTGLTTEIKTKQLVLDFRATKVMTAMQSALLTGLANQLSLKQIAERYINVQLNAEVSQLDPRAQQTYKELFARTFTFLVTTHKETASFLPAHPSEGEEKASYLPKQLPTLNPKFGKTLSLFEDINREAGDETASGKFLCSFVLNEIKEMKASSPAKGSSI